jgi:hypothetical protein
VPSYDAHFWQRRAREARAIAESMSRAVAKREMELIAAAYERLAERAERTHRRADRRQDC